jgi:hypothetical protein
MRLDFMNRDKATAAVFGPRSSKPYTGLPSSSPESNDVHVRVGALEETLMSQIQQVLAVHGCVVGSAVRVGRRTLAASVFACLLRCSECVAFCVLLEGHCQLLWRARFLGAGRRCNSWVGKSWTLSFGSRSCWLT